MKRKNAFKENSEAGYFLPADRRIGSCMTHRSDIVWVNATMRKDEILALVTANPGIGYLPVCSGQVDSVIGVLPVRDFLLSLFEPTWPGLRKLAKKPVFMPETVTAARALELIAENGCSLAFVIDEYGGIDGIVTRNALVSEILTEFSVEESAEENNIFRREDGSYLVGGQVRMDEIRKLFSLPAAENENTEFYTLAGYLLSINGSIPKTGDRIVAGGYSCEIVDMDGHRIDKVLVTEIAR